MENAAPMQEYAEDTFPSITGLGITTDPQEQMHLLLRINLLYQFHVNLLEEPRDTEVLLEFCCSSRTVNIIFANISMLA